MSSPAACISASSMDMRPIAHATITGDKVSFLETLALSLAEAFGDPEVQAGAETVEAVKAALATPEGQRAWAALQKFEALFVSGEIVVAPAHRVAPKDVPGRWEETAGGHYEWKTGA